MFKKLIFMKRNNQTHSGGGDNVGKDKNINHISGDYIQYIGKKFISGNLFAVILALTPFLIFSILGGGLGVLLGKQQSNNEIKNLQGNIVSLENTLNVKSEEIIKQKNLIEEKDKQIKELEKLIDKPKPKIDGSNQCILTITNKLVPLRSEPNPRSRELIRVKPDKYIPLEHKITNFAGGNLAWFKINAQGRIGWIEDNTWTINDKTAKCP